MVDKVCIVVGGGKGMGAAVAREMKKRNYDLPKEISSVNGRGLYIINECFDDIRWSNKGNRLQLALKR